MRAVTGALVAATAGLRGARLRRAMLGACMAALAASGKPAAAQPPHAQLTLTPDAALWSDVVEVRIDGVGCTGAAEVEFQPPSVFHIHVHDCGGTAEFSKVLRLGPLVPGEYIVEAFDADHVILDPPPAAFDTATLTVHRDADLRAEVPEPVISGAPFTLTLIGPASTGCHSFEAPVVTGNVIAMTYEDQCPFTPPGGPNIFREEFTVGPLVAGEYEVRMFENEFDLVPAMARRTIVVHDQAGCTPAATVLCLDGGRFRVTAAWEDFAHRTGSGTAVPLEAREDSGLFWFFAEDNIELTVKVLNGCGVNGKHWVFVSSGSTVRWTVTVTDTAHQAQRTYDNALGEAAPLRADTGAFECSPL